MRAIFLDFDGVGHPVSDIADWRDLSLHTTDLRELIAERNLFRWLPRLAATLEDHDDVMIFVHSAWRGVADNGLLKEILGDMAPRFVGITSRDLQRYAGIQEIVDRAGLDHYLVLDDATHEFPKDFEHLCAPDPELGLSDDSVIERLAQWLRETEQQSRSLSPAAAGG